MNSKIGNKTLLHNRTSSGQKFALIIFGVCLGLVLIETGLRLWGFTILSLQEYKNRVTLMRKSEYRILCLGESTTQGQYPFFLEEALNQRNIGIKFSVIDKGIVGTNTSAILSRLEFNLKVYRPDMVITMMGINDSEPNMPYEVISNSRAINFLKPFRTYKIIRLIWLHVIAKLKEVKFYKLMKNTARITFLPQRNKLQQVSAEYKYAPLSEKLLKLMRAIELNPKNDGAYVELGWACLNEGKISMAEQLCKKAIELNPKNDGAHVELAWIYQALGGKFSMAEQLCKKAIELNPKNDGAYVVLAWSYRNLGKVSEAEQLCKKAIELNPKNDGAYVELGRVYQKQGRFTQTAESYQKAIELNFDNVNAYVELGWACLNEGKFSEAEKLCKEALELNPKNYRICGALEVLCKETGNLVLAKEYGKRITELMWGSYNPTTARNYLKLKEILDRKGIVYVCAQYPMRSIEPLRKIFQSNEENIIFVDNDTIFKDALKKGGHKRYFSDMFGGDFGHCSEKGNRLLADNIASVILKEKFKNKTPFKD